MKIGFLDLETTGLDFERDRILEIALILVDHADLAVVAEIARPVRMPERRERAFTLDRDNDVRYRSAGAAYEGAATMHERSGLFDDIDLRGGDLSTVERLVIEMLTSNGVEPGSLYVSGFSIKFDRDFVRRWMPDLYRYFHHRSLDVSTLREFYALYGPDPQHKDRVKRADKHRAHPDALAAREVFDWYRGVLFQAAEHCDVCARECAAIGDPYVCNHARAVG